MSEVPTRPRRADRTCPACGSSELTEGFLGDSGEGSKGFIRWVQGPLERGWLGGAKWSGKPQRVVEALRCQMCSHLSLYATESA